MIALCFTVKDEEKFLARNIQYHLAAGVDAIYVFDDGSTDGTLNSIKDVPGVHLSPSVDPKDFLSHPDLGWVAEKAFEMITGRQVLNTHVALQQARLAGHEWIISIDADELVFVEDSLGIEGSLSRYFKSISPEIESVVFSTAELIPTQIHSDHPFLENVYFNTVPKANARIAHDPYTQMDFTLPSFLGHQIGKSAVRTRPDIIQHNVHRFISSTHGKLTELKENWLLHYNITSCEHFIDKYKRFKNRLDKFLNGSNIERQRALWIKLINDPAMDEKAILEYYQTYIMGDVDRLNAYPHVKMIDKVRRFFAAESEGVSVTPQQAQISTRNHVFIVTYGRTGSTLLLGILNSHPKINIMGESNGLFYELWHTLNTIDELEKHSSQMDKDTTVEPYYGARKFPYESFRKEITGLLGRFIPADESFETTGFKEVRYDMPDLDNYLDFLKTHFSNSRFIFLTREHDAVIHSGFYKGTDPDMMKNYLSIIEKRFCNYASDNTAESFAMTHKDLLNFDRIRELFAFLGYTADEETWHQVVSKKHSYAQHSLNLLTPNSNLILLNSSKKWLDASNFECPSHTVKLRSVFNLGGVIVPSAIAGALQSLILKNTSHEHTAKIGILSPRYAEKFPNNPLAKNARFSFSDSAPVLSDVSMDYDLIATFENTGPQTIARLFITP